MEISSKVRLFLRNNKDTLNKEPNKIDWEDFYYNTAMEELEGYEIGEIGTLFRNAHPEFYLDRIPQDFLNGSPIDYFIVPKRPDLEGIYARAFCNSNLKGIVIPHNIKKIGASAFEYCQNLKTVSFENGCTTICKYVFKECVKLEYIKLPETLKAIPRGCFWDCRSLRSLDIPKAVDKIGSEAFYDLENCIIDFEENFDLVIAKDAFPLDCDERGIKVSCYYDTPIYDYCQEHDIPFERLRRQN